MFSSPRLVKFNWQRGEIITILRRPRPMLTNQHLLRICFGPSSAETASRLSLSVDRARVYSAVPHAFSYREAASISLMLSTACTGRLCILPKLLYRRSYETILPANLFMTELARRCWCVYSVWGPTMYIQNILAAQWCTYYSSRPAP